MNDELFKILESSQPVQQKKACIGFDAVMDLLVTPVKNILPNGEKEVFRTIAEFGEFLSGKAGESCTIDLNTIGEKPGGNMVNLSAALGALELPVDCVGTFGRPDVLPEYTHLPKSCTLHSVAASGRCNALEFSDGKVMLAQMDKANELNYELLKKTLGMPKLQNLFGKAHFVGLVNWSEILASTDIWQGLLQDVFTVPDKTKYILFDFTDCTRHSSKAVLQAVEMLAEFTKTRTTIVSFNHNEAAFFAEVSGLAVQKELSVLAEKLRNRLKVDAVVIHPHNGAVCAQQNANTWVQGFYVAKPLVSTGGGDNFNAGLAMGLLCGLEMKNALLLGNAVASFYVQNGYSPNKKQVELFLKKQT